MINHRNNWLVALLAVLAVSVLPVAASAKSSSGLKSFHGKVSAVSTADRTFQVTRPGGGTLTFRVTATTVFQRLGGRLPALREGRAIEVKAKRVDGRWVARKVELDDDTPADDDGADHDAGDDHGSGGHGSDD